MNRAEFFLSEGWPTEGWSINKRQILYRAQSEHNRERFKRRRKCSKVDLKMRQVQTVQTVYILQRLYRLFRLQRRKRLGHQILSEWLSCLSPRMHYRCLQECTIDASKNALCKQSLNAAQNLCGFPPDSNSNHCQPVFNVFLVYGLGGYRTPILDGFL